MAAVASCGGYRILGKGDRDTDRVERSFSRASEDLIPRKILKLRASEMRMRVTMSPFLYLRWFGQTARISPQPL